MIQGLIYNLSLVVALSVIAGFVGPGRDWRHRRAVLQGFLFGVVAIISILTPVMVESGLRFDGRSVALSLCALFFGPLAGVVAGAMAAICRIMVGEPGTLTGVMVIVSSVALGSAFWRLWTVRKREPSGLQLYAFGLLVHVMMLIMFFALPLREAIAVLWEISIPVMLTYPLAMVLTGKILADQHARHRLIEQLKESEERFRAIFNSVSSVAIQTYDADGKVLSWNKGSETFYGYTAEEAIGRNFADLIIPPESMDKYLSILEESRKQDQHIPDLEATLRRKDGSTIVVFSRNGSIRLPGRPTEYFAMDVDLSERRVAEEKVLASERSLANAQRIAHLGSWENDLAAQVLTWTDETYRIFGVTRGEFAVTYDAFMNLVHPEDRADLERAQLEVQRGEAAMNQQYRIIRPDGEIRFIHERGELELDAEGRPAMASGTVLDVTDMVRAEEARRAAELLAQSTLDSLAAHIAILDERGVIIAVNESWRAFAERNGGSSQSMAEGADYLLVCDCAVEPDQKDAETVAAGIRSVLRGEVPDFAWEYPCHSPEEQRWFLARITRFEINGSARIVVAHENITHRKLAEQKHIADEERYQQQRNALIALMDVDVISEKDPLMALRKLTKVSARTMNVARASIWRFDQHRTGIECVDLYELEHDRHSADQALTAEQYPSYFKSLSGTDLIAADDVYTSQVTRELAEDYLRPLEITSMMDAPIHLNGVVDGVICYEHTGPRRSWTADEKTFAVAVANLVSLAMEGHERARAEMALRKSLRELSDLRAALDEHAVVSISDTEGNITYANDKFCEISKYPREELIGQNHRLINSSFHSREFFASLWETISSGRIWKGEVRNRAKDGSHYWVNATIVPYLDAAGKPFQYVAVRTDITERKRVEEELHGLAERLRHYLAVSPTITYAIRLIDGRMQSVWVSENVQHVLGYTPEEALMPSWWINHLHKDDRDLVLANQPIIQSVGSLTHEYRFLRKDGRVIWLRDELRLVSSDAATGEKEFVGAWTEITDRKRGEEERDRLEAQLVQSQKMESIGRLAGGVAHDFNNMLSVIIGHAEMALEETDARHPLRPDLEEIMRTSQRAADITKQLLAFARRQTSAPRVLNLNETITNMLSMLRRLTAASIELKWNPGEEIWPVRIDPAQVDQILANLIVNASDAIQGSGTITISTRNLSSRDQETKSDRTPMYQDVVELTIQDTGCGIEDEILPHIFDPFFTTKDMGKGTGLGLATVYGILYQNRGSIDVSSKVREGTTFQIRLPRYHASDDKKDDTGGFVRDTSGGQETILLVEDEQALLSLGIRFLKRLGYKVLASADPREAVRLFEANKDKIDLLMTDVVMPDMSGREVWEAVSAIRPDLKCLFVSGYTADVIATHGVLSEGVHFLQKPYTVDALGRKLREVIDA